MLRTFVAAITLGLAAPALAGKGHEWRPVDEATGLMGLTGDLDSTI